jgi:hypothetical protein
VSVTGSVCVVRLKLAALELAVASTVPSGLSKATAVVLIVLFVTLTVARWPAVPPKVRRAFWPGTVLATAVAAAPMVTVPVASAGTSKSWSVALPVLVVDGSTTTV